MKQTNVNKKIYTPELTFTIQIFKEGKTFVAHTPELDVSSCGDTIDEARINLNDAMRGFLKSAKKMGTFDQILEEAGFLHKGSKWITPQLMTLDRFTMSV